MHPITMETEVHTPTRAPSSAAQAGRTFNKRVREAELRPLVEIPPQLVVDGVLAATVQGTASLTASQITLVRLT